MDGDQVVDDSPYPSVIVIKTRDEKGRPQFMLQVDQGWRLEVISQPDKDTGEYTITQVEVPSGADLVFSVPNLELIEE